MNRSPYHLLEEVIIVDDASTVKESGNALDEYVAEHLPKVKIVRLSERQGLIRARVDGANVAKGEVLLFLDSHCEVFHNWLPPLLGSNTFDYFLFISTGQSVNFNPFSLRLHCRSNDL